MKMNKKAFIELDEINPFAILLAIVGGIIAFVMTGRAEVGGFWRIGSFVLTTIACFVLVQGMSS
jgi:uncharacterized membrane protein